MQVVCQLKYRYLSKIILWGLIKTMYTEFYILMEYNIGSYIHMHTSRYQLATAGKASLSTID